MIDDGQEVKLTAKEFMLLQYLLQHRGRVLSRDLLLGDVWGYRYTGGTRTVDVHVRRLREKLPLLVDALVTVKQFGYKLVEDPRSIASRPERLVRRIDRPGCAPASAPKSSSASSWRPLSSLLVDGAARCRRRCARSSVRHRAAAHR